jgi:endonuclease/exonuclease/phosphatase family metal-dependent hydrolase
MFEAVGPYLRRGLVSACAVVMCSASFLCTKADAQTTVVLSQPGSQVTDTTIRNGSYANTNHDGQPLHTRASDDPEWERRALLKIDTKNTIPQGATVASATLTLTVRSGLGTSGQTRPVHAVRISTPFQEADATWIVRQGSERWSTPGGDTAEFVAGTYVPNVAGARVSFNVTTLVQQAVNGAYDSRYTRIALLDAGGDAKESYREYYSSEDSTSSRRPTLTVVLASSSSAPAPPSGGGSTGTSLRVLHWNISQGYGTDGRSNIDRVVAFIARVRPDVVSFNEIMRYSSSSQPQMIADRLRAATGQTWRYHWVQKSGSSSGEGECVMTRLDIDGVDDHLLSYSRSVAMARVNVNGRNISVFSTHLDHTSSSYRLTQVRQLVSWASTQPEQRIVAGDFNWYPGTTEINEMGRTYHDGWAVARSAGDAYSYPGNPDGNTRNNRIDYVFYSRNASYLSVTRAEVFDTRDSSGHKPSDHNPLMVTFQVR